jgi:alpha-beta hydrolase superfamily lysophospholipase
MFNKVKKMITISRVLFIALFSIISAITMQTQTFRTPLNQVELLKKFIGTWHCELGEDTTMIAENVPFGTGMIGTSHISANGKNLDSVKQLFGYDKNLDKFIIAEQIESSPVIEICHTWFVSENAGEIVVVNPENSPLRFKFEFKTPDLIIQTAIQDNRIVKEISLIRMKDPNRTLASPDNEGSFYTTKNGCRLFVYDYKPNRNYLTTIFIVSGITGINHVKERDIIDLLSNNQNRVVVVHPRGTGYSEGKRGDIADFSDFINDYVEVITSDPDYISKKHKIVLFGHSMSTAIALAVAAKMEDVGGVILVNPSYRLKKAKGMSPNFGQYLKYAAYYIFARHTPIVNMAGEPSKIENEDDRKDSESRVNDHLLVKYFSMYYMIHTKRLMNSMIVFSRMAKYPLLLLYGEKDNIVDKKGCDILFDSWKCEIKQYLLIENGSHGKSTVILSKDAICRWIGVLENQTI